MFHQGHQVGSLLLAQWIPRRHIRAVHPAADRIEKILVGGQRAGGRGSALEDAQLKIARLLEQRGLHPRGILTVTVSQFAVTANTVPSVLILGIRGMAGEVANVASRGR
jgi:hypothetical protein